MTTTLENEDKTTTFDLDTDEIENKPLLIPISEFERKWNCRIEAPFDDVLNVHFNDGAMERIKYTRGVGNINCFAPIVGNSEISKNFTDDIKRIYADDDWLKRKWTDDEISINPIDDKVTQITIEAGTNHIIANIYKNSPNMIEFEKLKLSPEQYSLYGVSAINDIYLYSSKKPIFEVID